MNFSSLAAAAADPPGDFDPSLYIDFANLTIAVAMASCTLITFALAIVAVIGVRTVGELRRDREALRQDREMLQQELDEAGKRRGDLEKRVQVFADDAENIVQAAYHYLEGRSAYAAAKYERAIEHFETAESFQPGNDRFQTWRARSHVSLGQDYVALTILDPIIAREPAPAESLRTMAAIYRHSDRDKALHYVVKAVAADPASSECWDYFGVIQRDAGRWVESLAAHRRAADLDRHSPMPAFLAALVAARLNHKPMSDRFLAEAMERTSRRPVKRDWAELIRWAQTYAQGFVNKAHEIAGELAAHSVARTRAGVVDHMRFYLEALGENPDVNPSVLAFREREAIAVNA